MIWQSRMWSRRFDLNSTPHVLCTITHPVSSGTIDPMDSPVPLVPLFPRWTFFAFYHCDRWPFWCRKWGRLSLLAPISWLSILTLEGRLCREDIPGKSGLATDRILKENFKIYQFDPISGITARRCYCTLKYFLFFLFLSF